MTKAKATKAGKKAAPKAAAKKPASKAVAKKAAPKKAAANKASKTVTQIAQTVDKMTKGKGAKRDKIKLRGLFSGLLKSAGQLVDNQANALLGL